MSANDHIPWPYTRTWPVGTVKHGVLTIVIHKGLAHCGVFVEDGEFVSPYLLLWQEALAKARKGQRGTITRTDGGPRGLYWHWTPGETIR